MCLLSSLITTIIMKVLQNYANFTDGRALAAICESTCAVVYVFLIVTQMMHV